MNRLLKINFLVIILSLLIIPSFLIPNVNAQTSESSRILDRMQNIAQQGGYNTNTTDASIPRIVGLIINALLSITGLIFIFLTVFAGFNWMTSEGNEEKVKKAKDTLKSSVIGLILTLSAWTIWNFIFYNLII
jgi:hypothetical protein